jgi:hypothetical protein
VSQNDLTQDSTECYDELLAKSSGKACAVEERHHVPSEDGTYGVVRCAAGRTIDSLQWEYPRGPSVSEKGV